MSSGYTINVTQQLITEECINCGITFAVPRTFRQECLDDTGPNGKKFYCPNGHQMWYTGKTEAQQQKERADRAEADAARRLAMLDQERAEHEATQRKLTATKGVVTRTKRRIANGVCPCCKRTFPNVASHMADKHPDYVEPKEDAKTD